MSMRKAGFLCEGGRLNGQTVYVMCKYKDFQLVPVETPIGYEYCAFMAHAVLLCTNFETAIPAEDARFFDTKGVDDDYL